MIIQVGQPSGRNPGSQHAFPTRFRSKRVVEKIPSMGGYDLILSCSHVLWVPVDPGKKFYCGACLVELLARERATLARERALFHRAVSHVLRRHSCDVILQRHGGDVR